MKWWTVSDRASIEMNDDLASKRRLGTEVDDKGGLIMRLCALYGTGTLGSKVIGSVMA